MSFQPYHNDATRSVHKRTERHADARALLARIAHAFPPHLRVIEGGRDDRPAIRFALLRAAVLGDDGGTAA